KFGSPGTGKGTRRYQAELSMIRDHQRSATGAFDRSVLLPTGPKSVWINERTQKVRRPLTPLLGFMHPLIRIVSLIILPLSSSIGSAPSQQASGSPAKPTPASTPIPLAEVPSEAQAALDSLQEIEADVSKDQSSADAVARTALDLKSEIDARIAD